MNKTINIPHKKVQPSPQFKPLVAGEGVTLEELNQRITEISATGGGGGGQRIVVSPDMPTDLKENDFWYEVKQMQAYISLLGGFSPYFFIVSDHPIDDSSQENLLYLNDQSYSIDSNSGIYLENLDILTSELYNIITEGYGFDLPSDVIGQYGCLVACEMFMPVMLKGTNSVYFKIGSDYSKTITYDEPGLFFFKDVTASNSHILIANGQYSLSQLQSGTLTILKDGQEGDYSQYFNFNSGTELIDDAYIEETGIMADFKGLFASKLQISDNTPVGEYEISYELDGISTMEEANIIVTFSLLPNTDGTEFMLIYTFPFDSDELQINLDGSTLQPSEYSISDWDELLSQSVYDYYLEEYPDLQTSHIGSNFGFFTIDNLDIFKHIITASYGDYETSCEVGKDADLLCFTAEQDNSTIGMSHFGTNATSTKPTIYYSKDKKNWTLWDGANINLESIGTKVWMYGDGNSKISSSFNNYSSFSMSGKIAASGDLMTLISIDNPQLQNYCFYYLFAYCTSLTSAPKLSAQLLANYCYYYMFYGCTSLIETPELPATSDSPNCYTSMFEGCTSLTIAHDINFTTISGQTSCRRMFMSCTSLKNGPTIKATSLPGTNCCGDMFNGCNSLKSVTVYLTQPSWPNNAFSNWLNNVASGGILYCRSVVGTIPVGTSGIPGNWTRVNI